MDDRRDGERFSSAILPPYMRRSPKVTEVLPILYLSLSSVQEQGRPTTGDVVGHSCGAVCCLLAAMRSPSLRSLVLYEPPLHAGRADIEVAEAAQSALDDGDPDRALSVFFPHAVVTTEETDALRGFEPAWTRLRDGVRQSPARTARAIRATR